MPYSCVIFTKEAMFVINKLVEDVWYHLILTYHVYDSLFEGNVICKDAYQYFRVSTYLYILYRLGRGLGALAYHGKYLHNCLLGLMLVQENGLCCLMSVFIFSFLSYVINFPRLCVVIRHIPPTSMHFTQYGMVWTQDHTMMWLKNENNHNHASYRMWCFIF